MAISFRHFGVMVAKPTVNSPKLFYGTTRMWDAVLGTAGTHWRQIETARGVYDWAAFDAILTKFAADGRDVVFTFGDVPDWANGAAGRAALPTSLQDIYDFATAITTRAAGRIKYWEIWNELNQTTWFSGTMATMVTLAAGLRAAVKAVDPSAVILSPSVAGVTGPEALDAFLVAGGAASCDAMCIHGYVFSQQPKQVPEQHATILSYYKSMFANYGVGAKEFWVTEGSWGNGTIASGVGTPDQIAYGMIYQALTASAGVSRSIWYQYDNAASPAWGYLSDGTGTWLNAAGVAHREMTRWLMGSTFTTPISRIAATNALPHPDPTVGASAGVVGGSPNSGTMPTGWSLFNPDSGNGITASVVGTGTEAGIKYVDIRIQGTAGASPSGKNQIIFDTSNAITAAAGQNWTASVSIKLQAGSMANCTLDTDTTEQAGSSGIANVQNSGTASGASWQFIPKPYSLDRCQQSICSTLTAPTCNNIKFYAALRYAAGAVVDVTLRVGAPTLDKGSIWTGTIQRQDGSSADIVWDASGGPTAYSVPNGYIYSRDNTGTQAAISGGAVSLSSAPILLESTPVAVRL